MFTRRHYIAIANVIARAYDEAESDRAVEGVLSVEQGLSALFGLDNANFEPRLFEGACRLGPPKAEELIENYDAVNGENRI